MTTNTVLTDDIQDAVSKALRRAWGLGQTYWQQADSEYQSQWKKSDETQAKFDALVDETRALVEQAVLAKVQAQQAVSQDVVDAARYRWWRDYYLDSDVAVVDELSLATTHAELDEAIDAARSRVEGES